MQGTLRRGRSAAPYRCRRPRIEPLLTSCMRGRPSPGVTNTRAPIASRLTGGRPSSRTVSQWFPAPASPAFRYSMKPTSKFPTTKSEAVAVVVAHAGLGPLVPGRRRHRSCRASRGPNQPAWHTMDIAKLIPTTLAVLCAASRRAARGTDRSGLIEVTLSATLLCKLDGAHGGSDCVRSRPNPSRVSTRREAIPDAALCDAVRRAGRGQVDADLGGGVINVYGFAKSGRDNLRQDEFTAFRLLAEQMLGMGEAGLRAALERDDNGGGMR